MFIHSGEGVGSPQKSDDLLPKRYRQIQLSSLLIWGWRYPDHDMVFIPVQMPAAARLVVREKLCRQWHAVSRQTEESIVNVQAIFQTRDA